VALGEDKTGGGKLRCIWRGPGSKKVFARKNRASKSKKGDEKGNRDQTTKKEAETTKKRILYKLREEKFATFGSGDPSWVLRRPDRHQRPCVRRGGMWENSLLDARGKLKCAGSKAGQGGRA